MPMLSKFALTAGSRRAVTVSMCELASRNHSITSSARASKARRYVEAERFGGFEIDDEFDFRDLLYRQISWVLTVEDAAGVDANQAIQFIDTASVAHQAACRHELTIRRYRRHGVARCQSGELRAFSRKQRICGDHEPACPLLDQRGEDAIQVGFGTGLKDVDRLQPKGISRRLCLS